MAVTLTGTNITFSNGTTDSTSSSEPIIRYEAYVSGNSNTYSSQTSQYHDITCSADAPCPIMILNYDYWTVWGGWSDIWYSTVNYQQSYADRFKTRPDSRDFIRCQWAQGALGGPHTIRIKLFY